MNKIFIGSNNRSKVSDWRIYLGDDFEILSPDDLKINLDVSETDDSLENNAVLKAIFWAKHSGFITLSEDSGIFMSGDKRILGINTKRWLKGNNINKENIKKFIDTLPNKKCTFKICIAVANPEGIVHSFTQIIKGKLTTESIVNNPKDDEYLLGKYFVSENRDKSWSDMSEKERKQEDGLLVNKAKEYFNKLFVYEKVVQQINKRPNKIPLGFPTSKPDILAVDTFNYATSFQANNCGFHTNQTGHKNPFKVQEIKSIEKVSNFLGGKNEDGYINSGATESNLMGIWIAREIFRKRKDIKNIVLLKTSLTHYSVSKSANILNISEVKNVKLNKDFEMDLNSFKKELDKHLKKGKAVIVVATAGYNVTGTVDNIKEIDNIICLNKQKDNIYLHLDAATLGFVSPFVDDNSRYLKYKSIQSVSLDGHKLGLIPYPCGIFISRKGNIKHIAKKIEYLGSEDRTIIGSRTGASASALYAMTCGLGSKHFTKIAKECLDNKKYFISKLRDHFKDANIITSPFSVIFGISFGKHLPKEIETKYSLHSTEISLNHSREDYYQIVVTPDINRLVVDNLINEILQARLRESYL